MIKQLLTLIAFCGLIGGMVGIMLPVFTGSNFPSDYYLIPIFCLLLAALAGYIGGKMDKNVEKESIKKTDDLLDKF
jgi:hypothetical protein